MNENDSFLASEKCLSAVGYPSIERENQEESTERWRRHWNNNVCDAALKLLEETWKSKIVGDIVEDGVCPLDNPDEGDVSDC